MLAPHAEAHRDCSPLVVNTIFFTWHARMKILQPKAASQELLCSYLLLSSTRSQSCYDQSSEQSSSAWNLFFCCFYFVSRLSRSVVFGSALKHSHTLCACAEWVTQCTTDCVWSTKWAEDSTTASRCVCQQQVALAGELSFLHSEWDHWSCVWILILLGLLHPDNLHVWISPLSTPGFKLCCSGLNSVTRGV